MGLSLKKKEEALGILKEYKGKNPYIFMTKKQLYSSTNGGDITDFQYEYILRNHDRDPQAINRIVKIADWYGEKKKEDWCLEFIPTKLKITQLLGESETTWHCYVQFRQSVDPCMCFLPKRAVLTNFLLPDYHNVEIDFDRYDNLSMSKDPNRRLREHQKEAVRFLTTRKKCVLADDMGLGKMEPVSSMIPTINGYVRMGDITVGDSVFGRDGHVYKVTGTFPHQNKEIYRVTFSDGTYADCGLDHLWVVRDSNMRIRKQGWAVKSVSELLQSGIHYKDEERIKKGLNPRNKYEIPVCEPVEYPERTYFIHPYLLGLCIGDGNLCNGGTIISCPDFDYENIERAIPLLHTDYEFYKDNLPSCPRYRIRLKKEITTYHNEYNIEIKRLGLNIHGNDKFIPDEYKFGSIEQRIDLLRGLMDTDGYITGSNNKISYSTKSPKLANDVAELVYSLGGTARVHSYDRSDEGKGIEYMVNMQIKINPFYLKRKAERYSPTFKKYCTKYIEKIEYNRNEDAKCISVDSPDKTYLTGDRYIVTHNTTALSVSAHYGNFDSVLIICPASLKTNWKQELMWYIPEKDITIVDGFLDKKKGDLEKFLGYGVGKSGKSKDELLAEAKEAGKWQDNHYVIINFDILDEFYHIPVTRSAANIQVAYDNSPMLQYLKGKKSLIIIDEAHKLSNSKSDRYKVLKDLINRAKPDSIYLSTGTPITNNPQNLYCVLKFLDDPITDDWQFYMERYCGAKQIPAKGERDRLFADFLRMHHKTGWNDLTSSERDEYKEWFWDNCRKITVMDGSTNLDELKDRISHIYLRRTKEDLNTLPAKNIHEVYYDLTPQQETEYRRLWLDYETAQAQIDPDKELNKDLLEGALYRKYISDIMVPNTIKLVDNIIKDGEKCLIITCFDDELNSLKEYYGDRCVVYNGKMSPKQKDAAKDKFLTDENIKVFIGNVISAGVGLTLTVSKYLVFNSFSFVPSDNRQAEDRIYRIGQTRDVDIYYQMFRRTQFQHMWDVVLKKETIINKVIKKENEKNAK